MASQQTLEIVDQLIAHYSHPVAVWQITTGTIQSKSPEEYALQALNTTALLT